MGGGTILPPAPAGLAQDLNLLIRMQSVINREVQVTRKGMRFWVVFFRLPCSQILAGIRQEAKLPRQDWFQDFVQIATMRSYKKGRVFARPFYSALGLKMPFRHSLNADPSP